MTTIITRKISLILFACVITSLLCIQSTQARQLPQRGPIPFFIYDINANGFISQDEFQTIRSQRMENRMNQAYPGQGPVSEPDFAQFDADKDSRLSPDELARGQQLQMEKQWQRRQDRRMGMMQGQGRGMGTAPNMPVFEEFDQNNDGVLTPDEFSMGMQQHRQQRQASGQAQGMAMRQGQGRGMNRGRNMPKFADYDGDKDGYISEQELIQARSMRISSRIQQGYQMRNTANIPQFQEIDKDADGKISPEEFSTQQKKHQTERH